MIRVEPKPEPSDFDEQVRRPGQAALAAASAVGRDIAASDLPPYWRRCLPQLYRRYEAICAYLAVWIPPAAGNRTVDHFVAKSTSPELAYEWLNYRLATSQMNACKGCFDDVLDPFEIEDGWFELELSGLQVVAAPALDAEIGALVQRTIERLRLNDDDPRELRAGYYDAFLTGNLTLEYLLEYCPFVAREIQRQGIRPHPRR